MVAFASFVSALILCLSLRILMGTVVFPTPAVQVGLWILEVMLYLIVFSALGVSMVSAGLVVRGR
jgi:hypothetical protein